jgi:hypothetical protein
MNLYYFWPISALIFFSAHAYLSYLNNQSGGYKYFFASWIFGAIIPFWPIISRFSKNLMFDGMLYDMIIFTSYSLTFFFLEKHFEKFTAINYTGLMMVIFGMIFLKIK